MNDDVTSLRRRWPNAMRWARQLLVLIVAFGNTTCLTDLVTTPDETTYDFDAVGSLTYTVNVGDTMPELPMSVRLLVNGEARTTAIRAIVIVGEDVVTVDSSLRLIVHKPGTATVRVIPVNAGLPEDKDLHKDFDLIAVSPRAIITGPDTIASIGDTIQYAGQGATRLDQPIPGTTVTWSISGQDTAAKLLSGGRLHAVKVGDVTLKAQTDTGSRTKLVRVRQKVARIQVSPPGDSATPTRQNPVLSATAYDARDNVIPNAPINWLSTNTSIAQIGQSSGIVTGVATGQAVIAAQSGTVTGYALVSVVVPVATPVNLWAPMASNTNTELNGVFGTNASNVYAVGNGGVIRRWNGTSWLSHANSSADNLNAVWAVSTLGFAVGANGTIRQWDGNQTWNAVTSNTNVTLSSIWGTGPNGIHIGGTGRIVSNTSGTFTSQSTTGAVTGIWGTSPINALAVNNASQTLWTYDGVSWLTTGTTLPGPGPMAAMWGLTASRRYAVGGGSLRIYDGTAWTAHQIGDGQIAMNAVWGSGPGDVYVVGTNGAIARQAAGGAWQIEPSGVSATLRGIWGIGSDVFVVGDGGTILRGFRGATLTVSTVSAITTLGGTRQLTATARDASSATIAGTISYTWASSDTLVARVSSSGLVTGGVNGTASVCATAAGGVTDCEPVSVNVPIGPVDNVTVTTSGATISGVGNTTTLTAVARDDNGNVVPGKTPVWVSRNTAIATVNSTTGVVTAVQSGQVSIEAAVDGKVGYGLVTVSVPDATPVNLWTPMASGTSANLHGVWGAGTGDVYAVGAAGTIRKLNNDAWVEVPSPTSETLVRVAGFSGVDLFAVGAVGTVASRNGSSSFWSTTGVGGNLLFSGVWVASPGEVYVTSEAATSGASHLLRYNGAGWLESGSRQKPLTGIWGTSRSDIFATNTDGEVERFDGSAWSVSGSGGPPLKSIWGTSSSSVFAVGDGGTTRLFDGSAWQSLSSGTSETLHDVWGSSPSDVYAVGSTGTILRYNGSAWSAVTSGTTQRLRGVWGTSGGDVYAVGFAGTILRGVRGATVTVTPVSPTLTSIGGTQQLTATAKDANNTTVNGATFTWTSSNPAVVTVDAAGLVTAVAAGTANVCATAPGGVQGCTTVSVGPSVATIDVTPTSATLSGSGTTLSATPKDGLGNTVGGVTLTWTSLNPSVASVNSSTGVVTPVGSGQVTIAASAGGATGYAIITVIPASVSAVNLWRPVASNTSQGLNGAWGASADVVWAVGDNGVIRRWDGSTWQAATGVPSLPSLKGIWGFADTSVYTVGNGGQIARYSGSTWTAMTSPVSDALNAVWGSSPNDVFAVGVSGKIVRFNGTSWSEMTSTTSATLRAVYGFSPTQVYAVGDNGTVLRYNGSNWSSAATGMSVDESLTSLFGTTTSNLTAVGASGKVWTMNLATSTWTLHTDLGANGALNGLWGSAPFDIVAVGASGAVQRFAGGPWVPAQSGLETFRAAWGTSVGEVWAVGAVGTIHRGYRNATITLSPSPLSLSSVGQSQLLTADVRDAANNALADVSLTWTSSNPAAATVSSSGDVAAVADGSTSVCATAPGGAQGCVSVTVGVAPATVVVTPGGALLSGGTTTLTATAKDAGGTPVPNQSFQWASLNPNVATVHPSTGVVTPVASGQVTISATVGAITGYSVVTVTVPSVVAVNLWASPSALTGNEWRSVWVASDTSAWAVGLAGNAMHWDGTAWSLVSSGTSGALAGVYGLNGSDVYAVGGPVAQEFRRYTGSWATLPNGGELNDVWVAGPGQVYAAGSLGAHRYDGTAWTQQLSTTPDPLFAIWGLSANDVWAAGWAGQFHRYDGATWNTFPSPTSSVMSDIWGTDASNVWVVGGAGDAVFRWNGSGWTQHTPIPGTPSELAARNWTGVWGTSSTDVYVVGERAVDEAILAHYNGSSWTNVNLGVIPKLRAIAGTSTGAVHAVGKLGVMLTGYRGATVTVTPTAPSLSAVGNTQQLTATAKDASNNTINAAVAYEWTSSAPAAATVSASGLVTAAGNGTTNVCATAPGGAQGCVSVEVGVTVATVELSPAGLSLSSGTGSLTATAKDAGGTAIPNTSFLWSSLNPAVATVNSSTGVITPVSSGQAAISVTAGSVTTYGVVTVAASPGTPVNLWASVPSPTGQLLFDGWAADASNVYAVGAAGVVLKYNGTSWVTIDSGFTSFARGVSGLHANAVMVATDDGIRSWNGATWSTTSLGTGLGDVWSLTPTSAFATTGGSTLRYFDGTTWQSSNAITPGALGDRTVWASAPSNAVGTFGDGIFGRWSGATLTSVPVSGTLNRVWGVSAADLYATLHGDGVLRSTNSGASWAAVSPAAPSGCCMGLWAASNTEVWATSIESSAAKVLHFNGSAWETINTGLGVNLYGLAGTSSGDVWAFGNSGKIARGVRGASVTLSPVSPTLTALSETVQLTPAAKDASNNTINGTVAYAWTSSTEGVATVSASGLVTAVANGTTNVCATAPGGAQGCVLLTVQQAVASLSISPNTVSISSGSAPLTATAKDANDNTIAGQTVTWQSLNQSVASVTSGGVVSPVASGVTAVSASAGGVTAYALVTASPVYSNVNLWAQEASGTPNNLARVWGSAANNVYVGGTGGVMRRFDGTAWQPVSSPTTDDIVSFWGLADTVLFAGSATAIYRFDGAAWTEILTFASPTGSVIWGTSPSNVYVLAGGTSLRHFDGTSWTTIASLPSGYWRDIWGSGPDNLYVVGDGPAVYRFDGTNWHEQSTGLTPSNGQVWAVWGTGPNDVFVQTQTQTARYTGAWNVISNQTTGTHNLWGTSGADIYAARTGFSGSGGVGVFNGSTWTVLTGLGTAGLRAVYGPPVPGGGSVYGVSYNGEVYRGYRGATITVSPDSWTLTSVGATQQLTATARDASGAVIPGTVAYAWSSSNPASVTVSASGLVTAEALGTSTVCVGVNTGLQGCATVSVTPAVASITIDPGELALSAGNGNLTATAKDAGGATIPDVSFNWSSLNTGVATVDAANGASTQITGVSTGQTAIAVTVGGVTAYATVTVTKAPAAPLNLWTTQSSPTAAEMRAIWGSAPNNIFAVGAGGTIIRYDGSSWQPMNDPGDDYYDIHGTSASNVFAVGNNGRVSRFNGSAWSDLTSNVSGQLQAVWAASPNDVFAAGINGAWTRYNGSTWTAATISNGNLLTGLWGTSASNVYAGNDDKVFQFNGSAWNDAGAPIPGSGGGAAAAWGAGPADVWTVGRNGVVLRNTGTWAELNNPSGFPRLNAIWGATSSDVYVVGQGARVQHWNGSVWTEFFPAPVEFELRGIWGSSDGDAWIVGDNGIIVRGVRGATITVAPASPTLTAFGAQTTLSYTAKDQANNTVTVSSGSITWTSSNEGVAVVNANGTVGAIGNGTTSVCVTAIGGAQGCTTVTVNQAVASVTISPVGASVSSGGTTTFTATGRDANNFVIDGQAFTWTSLNTAVATVNASTGAVTPVGSGQVVIEAAADGVKGFGLATVTSTGLVPVNLYAIEHSVPGTPRFDDVWAVDSDNVFAVSTAGVYQRAGSTWGVSFAGSQFRAVWGAAANDVFVVGHQGRVARYNGSSWTPFDVAVAGATETLFAAWGSSPTNVIAVGAAGRVLRFDGGAWSTMTSNTADDLTSVWGSSTTDVFAVGGTSIIRYDGTQWTSMSHPGTGTLVSVWGFSPTEVYALESTGPNKGLLRFDGTSWSRVAGADNATAAATYDVWGTSGSDLYVAVDSKVRRFDGSTWFTPTTPMGSDLRALVGVGAGTMTIGNNIGHLVRGYRGATGEIAPATPTLAALGATLQLTPTFKDAGGTPIATSAYLWTSSASGVVSVTGGLVTAVAPGAANVCATASGGVQACTAVTVNQAAASIVVTPGGATISGGGTTTFSASAKDANDNPIGGQAFTWASLNPNVATINASTGEMTPVANGQVTIAASADGVTAYALVTVKRTDLAPVNLWAAMASNTTEELLDVWGTSANNVYAVGTGGVIRRYNGTSWDTETSQTGAALTGVWGASATDVYAVGGNIVWRNTGSGWTPFAQLESGLTGIWGAGPNSIIAIRSSAAYRFNGTSWDTTVVGVGSSRVDLQACKLEYSIVSPK